MLLIDHTRGMEVSPECIQGRRSCKKKKKTRDDAPKKMYDGVPRNLMSIRSCAKRRMHVGQNCTKKKSDHRDGVCTKEVSIM